MPHEERLSFLMPTYNHKKYNICMYNVRTGKTKMTFADIYDHLPSYIGLVDYIIYLV